MTFDLPENVKDIAVLRDRTGVFADRADAGGRLAEMLAAYRGAGALVLGIPAGGLAVASEIAAGLGLALDAAIVSKITLPWNTEAGYGAVAYDGTVLLDNALVAQANLSEQDVRDGTAKAREKVRRRMTSIRAGRPMPDLTGRRIILTDDGLATGLTVRAALRALAGAGAADVVLAVPTGHLESVRNLSGQVRELYCPTSAPAGATPWRRRIGGGTTWGKRRRPGCCASSDSTETRRDCGASNSSHAQRSREIHKGSVIVPRYLSQCWTVFRSSVTSDWGGWSSWT